MPSRSYPRPPEADSTDTGLRRLSQRVPRATLRRNIESVRQCTPRYARVRQERDAFSHPPRPRVSGSLRDRTHVWSSRPGHLRFCRSALQGGGVVYVSGTEAPSRPSATRVAAFLEVDADDIAYVSNTAEGVGLIANGYPFEPGDQVISYVHEVPSNHYPWALQSERGVELILLSDVDPIGDFRPARQVAGPWRSWRPGRLSARA